MYNKEKPQ